MKKILSIGIFFFLLAGCGAKKNVAVSSQELAVSTLEQRIAAGEFAWLDTIQIDTTSIWVKYFSGHYILSHQNSIHGQRIGEEPIKIDSLVLLSTGYYGKYKKDSLVEYGRYAVRNRSSFKLCVEQYKIDWETGTLTNEIERVEKEYPEKDVFLMDFYSCYRDYHCYWISSVHHYDPYWKELTIILDIHNDCLKLHNNFDDGETTWITKH